MQKDLSRPSKGGSTLVMQRWGHGASNAMPRCSSLGQGNKLYKRSWRYDTNNEILCLSFKLYKLYKNFILLKPFI